MANKFIVFVVFAAVAQAALAAHARGRGSSNVKSAQEKSRNAWHLVAETVCKAVSQKSWSIDAAKAEYQKHQADGGAAFFGVAPNGKNQNLRNQAAAHSKAFRDGLFKAVADARKCRNYGHAKAAIEQTKNHLPYAQLVNDFHKLTKNTGSTSQAVNQLKNVYARLFAEVEKLAKVTCGGQRSLGHCATNEIHGAVDAITNTVYSWVH